MDEKRSCGECNYFAESGYEGWGICSAPAPAWACKDRGVTQDGGEYDVAANCEFYEKAENDEQPRTRR